MQRFLDRISRNHVIAVSSLAEGNRVSRRLLMMFVVAVMAAVPVGASASDIQVTDCGPDADGTKQYGYGGNCGGFAEPDSDASASAQRATVSGPTGGSQPVPVSQAADPVATQDPTATQVPEVPPVGLQSDPLLEALHQLLFS